LPYQYVISTTNKLLSLNAWLQYHAKVRTRAAAHPALGWNQNAKASRWMLMLPAAKSNIVGPVHIADPYYPF